MEDKHKIKLWLSRVLNCTVEDIIMQAIPGDASSRCYYRIFCDQFSYILMCATVDEGFFNFIYLNDKLNQQGIHVPQIIDKLLHSGLILLEDFGDEIYLQHLNSTDSTVVLELYRQAINSLLSMQHMPNVNALDLPVMSKNYIIEKLDIFYQWYIQQHLSCKLDNWPLLRKNLINIFQQAFIVQPFSFVHLDYHSKNLMLTKEKNPGILDFQDAMYGPLNYDLVSLLQDAYIVLPNNKIATLLNYYYQRSQFDLPSYDSFVKSFYLIGVQRHLKNLGVFTRLHHRDGKSNYLKYIPTLLRYISESCEKYLELKILDKVLIETALEFKGE